MQATVREFDATDGSGSVFFDDGTVGGFGPEVFAASGLQLLRRGQRVAIRRDHRPEPGHTAAAGCGGRAGCEGRADAVMRRIGSSRLACDRQPARAALLVPGYLFGMAQGQ